MAKQENDLMKLFKYNQECNNKIEKNNATILSNTWKIARLEEAKLKLELHSFDASLGKSRYDFEAFIMACSGGWNGATQNLARFGMAQVGNDWTEYANSIDAMTFFIQLKINELNEQNENVLKDIFNINTQRDNLKKLLSKK